MKFAKLLARIGFAVGLVGPLLFYLGPYAFLYESHVVCPACPYVELPFATKMTWLEVALKLGLLCGLVYGMIGFGIGYSISKLRALHRHQKHHV